MLFSGWSSSSQVAASREHPTVSRPINEWALTETKRLAESSSRREKVERADRDQTPVRSEDLYLDLLKRALINTLYLEDEERIYYLRQCLRGEAQFDYQTLHNVRQEYPEVHEEYLRSRRIGQFPYRDIHNSGFNHSMIGQLRMDNLHQCMEIIRHERISGDLMECGVWRGGACIFMQGYLRVYGMTKRRVFLADSFEGLPRPENNDSMDLSKDKFPELAVGRAEVERHFEHYDLLDENVIFLAGWFNETLPTAPTYQLALLRLDGDLYDSTMEPLVHQYKNVVSGGIVIVDDYNNLPECRAAVRDFFSTRGEALPEHEEVDWTAIWWRKP